VNEHWNKELSKCVSIEVAIFIMDVSRSDHIIKPTLVFCSRLWLMGLVKQDSIFDLHFSTN